MLPTAAVRQRLGTLLSTDTTTLDQATNQNEIILVTNSFVPNENLTVASFTVATFTGSGGVACPVGAALVGIDPITQEQIVTIPVPAGGYRWITGDAVNLPQTITGYILTTKSAALLLAMRLFDTPKTLDAAGQEIDLDPVQLRFVLQPIS